MTDYFVDPVSGSDANPGTAYNNAFETVSAAITAMSVGDVVYLMNTGTHTVNDVTLGVTGTSQAEPIMLIGADSNGDPLTGTTRTTIDGTGATNGIFTNTADQYLTLKNIQAQNGGCLVYVNGGLLWPTIVNCLCTSFTYLFNRNTAHHCYSRLIYSELSSMTSLASTVANREVFKNIVGCYIHGFSGPLSISASSWASISDTIFADFTNDVIDESFYEVGAVTGCVFYDIGGNCFYLGDRASSDYQLLILRNNIFHNVGRVTYIEGDGTVDSDYNCYGTSTSVYTNATTQHPKGANDITSDPLMTDPANEDFTLQSGSPCIGERLVVPA